MWNDIILTLAPMALEAVGTKFLQEQKKIKIQKKLDTVINNLFIRYADTSLDCESFYNFINSYKFEELLRNYFFITSDNIGKDEYLLNVENIIISECTGININEMRQFLHSLEELYISSLRSIVEDNPEINTAFQLMSFTHRELISKIRDSEIELKRYIDSINNRTTQLTDNDIKNYHIVAEKEFGIIRFTGISGAERNRPQKINDYYVESSFSYYGKQIDKIYNDQSYEIDSIQLTSFFDLGNKIVLIGGAGLGKSTTLNFLFCNYENLYHSHALKLKLDLKDYAKEIGEKKKSILWCIANEFFKRIPHGSLTLEEVENLIASKLQEGKCLVILDALDEIPTPHIRSKVRDEIETFTNVYYLNRFIISTREVGYLKNRFDDTFLHIRINKFNDEQIKLYSKNWYISNYEERNKFDEFWNSFEIEVERARCKNLINNPIILILALVIFDCENRLPTRRIEFYEKCIKTFLTERELHREVFILSEKAKSILVMNLTLPKVAHYKFKKLKEDVGYKFNSDELIKAIKNAIEITDDIEWNAPVNQYSQYLIMRTELIHEIDENTFDFAHKTFFEYFLSIYFSKTSTTTTLISLLKGWIGDANYDELARLIVEVVIQNNDQRQVDAVMQYLFNALDRKTYINNIESRRILDVFCLLADLYEHNLIPPKYHKQYNQFILYNPQYIERVERNLIVWGERRKINRIKYDERCIAIDFCKELEANNLPDVVNSIIFLNNEYQRRLLELNSNPLLYHINSLFSLNRRQIHKSEEKNRREYKIRELNYFLNDALSFTLSTPQIFLAIISIAIDIECYDCIDVLLNYSFKPNDETYLHMDPNTLIKLVKLSKESKAAFSLLLIVLTECLYEKTNSMFRFLFKVRIKEREPSGTLTGGDKTLLIKLWRSLNNSETFEDFRDAINNLNLYDASYDRIYNRTFSTYINYSKGIGDEEIEKYINCHE